MSTGTTNSQTLSRPQPVGILPIPAGLLVLPGAADAALVQQCIAGQTDTKLPDVWSFYQHARDGDWPLALEHICTLDSPIASYNRFVLNPLPVTWMALRRSLTGELRQLLEIAAYSFGMTDDVPSADGLDGELLALALMTQAAAELARESTHTAIPLLEQAIAASREPSPLFAVQLLAQLATVCRAQPRPFYGVIAGYYRDAIALIGEARMPELASDLWMQLAMVCQEGAMGRHAWMTEAIGAYQEALRSGLTPDDHPELFALAHNNLGLLYLSNGMGEGGDQLRMAIAVQSFREGLRCCDQEAHPELRASIQLNLANALQYMPSSHPQENLEQAVELYETLVTDRKKAFDPVGYGRVLSNQANALAHLGIFGPALEKLQEARKLFEWHNESDLAASTMELVNQIHARKSVPGGSEDGPA